VSVHHEYGRLTLATAWLLLVLVLNVASQITTDRLDTVHQRFSITNLQQALTAKVGDHEIHYTPSSMLGELDRSTLNGSALEFHLSTASSQTFDNKRQC